MGWYAEAAKNTYRVLYCRRYCLASEQQVQRRGWLLYPNQCEEAQVVVGVLYTHAAAHTLLCLAACLPACREHQEEDHAYGPKGDQPHPYKDGDDSYHQHKQEPYQAEQEHPASKQEGPQGKPEGPHTSYKLVPSEDDYHKLYAGPGECGCATQSVIQAVA